MNSESYWNEFSSKYLQVWTKYAHRKILNNIEKNFIGNAINDYKQSCSRKSYRYLDLGSGPGRIIDILMHIDPQAKLITGIDQSQKMVNLSRDRFKSFHNVSIVRASIEGKLPLIAKPVDVVTCIRVLKYFSDRQSIFLSVSKILSPKGIFIFTVTNAQSLAIFDFLAVDHFKDTHKHITEILNSTNFEVVTITGFQKIPEFLHILASKAGMASVLFAIEGFLTYLLGETFLARTLYYVVKRKA